nr:MAG TPA: hypothetical protein [Caudoviricetes sp.]
MDEKAWAIIKAIITKGNDAVVRKKGDGYIVLEDKREINMGHYQGHHYQRKRRRSPKKRRWVHCSGGQAGNQVPGKRKPPRLGAEERH